MAGANKRALDTAKRILGITPRMSPADAILTPAQRLHKHTTTHPIHRASDNDPEPEVVIEGTGMDHLRRLSAAQGTDKANE